MSTDPERIIRLRLCESNLRLLERGVNVTNVRLAEGVDGIYEAHFEGEGESPFKGGPDPLVALREDPDGH